jgi:formylglycine-generating enzyme required for sulfatase activity
MPTMTLFISYSRQDEPILARLRADLSRAGAVIWIDHEQVTPGTPNWQLAIREGIEAAQAVVYLASPEAARSAYVLDEVSLARAKGRRVVPFWVRGEQWHDCAPLGFGMTQFADGRGERYAGGLRELLVALGLTADATATPFTPPMVSTGMPLDARTQRARELAAEARAALAAGHWQDALLKAELALSLPENAHDAELPVLLVQAAAGAGQWERAREAAQRAIAQDGLDPRLYVLLAQAERALGHPDQALAALDRAQALTPLGTNEQLAALTAERLRALVPQRLTSLGFAARKVDGVEVIVPPLCDVPAGEFFMGSDPKRDKAAYDWEDEKPQHGVTLAMFQIGRYPVTVAEYACFVRLGQKEPGNWRAQVAKLDHSVVNVTWHDAAAYAAWLAKLTGQLWHLPTEAEWEKAARGTDGRIYLWGDAFDRARCNTIESGIGTTTPVGSYPNGASPYGTQDMAGNVWEWVSSHFKPYPYRADDGRERVDSPGSFVLRGGTWGVDGRFARAAHRNYFGQTDLNDGVRGFRLARAQGGVGS